MFSSEPRRLKSYDSVLAYRSVGLLALRSKAAVYGSPLASLREDLWSELMAMADTISEPWLIALEYAYDSDLSIWRQKERIAEDRVLSFYYLSSFRLN